MSTDDRIEELEAVLARFLQPLRGIPFPVVIRALADCAVLAMDRDDPRDQRLVDHISAAAHIAGDLVRADPIRRNRPNEVGNDIEPFVMRALGEVGLRAERPRSARGRGQQVGYPDVLLYDEEGRPSYRECKTFGEGKAMTTMRSFYFSPSANPKICADARHVLLAFEVRGESVAGSRDSYYRATSFKLIDLFGLKCDVKYEFNADNARLYDEAMLLAHGAL